MFKGDCAACLKYNDHSKLSSQHKLGSQGEPILRSSKHANPHFHHEQDIHMSSKNDEESDHGLDVDLRITLY